MRSYPPHMRLQVFNCPLFNYKLAHCDSYFALMFLVPVYWWNRDSQHESKTPTVSTKISTLWFLDLTRVVASSIPIMLVLIGVILGNKMTQRQHITPHLIGQAMAVVFATHWWLLFELKYIIGILCSSTLCLCAVAVCVQILQYSAVYMLYMDVRSIKKARTKRQRFLKFAHRHIVLIEEAHNIVHRMTIATPQPFVEVDN